MQCIVGRLYSEGSSSGESELCQRRYGVGFSPESVDLLPACRGQTTGSKHRSSAGAGGLEAHFLPDSSRKHTFTNDALSSISYYQHMRVTSGRLWFSSFSNSSPMDNGAHGFLISAKGRRRIVEGKLGKNSSSVPSNNKTLILVYPGILVGSRPYSHPRVRIPRRTLVMFGNCGGLTSGQTPSPVKKTTPNVRDGIPWEARERSADASFHD